MPENCEGHNAQWASVTEPEGGRGGLRNRRAGSDSDTYELSTRSCRGHSDEQDRQVPVVMELLVLAVVVGFADH